MSLSPTNPSPRILVFDSGVGGLSIVHEIQQKLPFVPLIYVSDNAFFPYGTKGEAELISRVDAVFHKLTETYAVDIIVVACNTASTLTLPHIRSHFSQPIVGVVPAIKPAAAQSKSQVIGLLATPATVARPYTHNLIREHAPNADVISVGSSELVQLAEKKLRGEKISSQQIRPILQPFFDHPRGDEMDALVLACTHFPLLRDELRIQFPAHVQLIDSGEAIARRVVSLLGDRKFAEQAPEHLAVFTKASPAVTALQPQLAQFGIHNLDILEV
ncbi:glutamate racemase [Cellvibrio zantedeschiae]|uniref:Glutamate racemase n=1 Tax=Cellvibrio zantedeschiae TaxID=1237077 RepID=A0ABQ3AWG2_9GAMM|nr:glutamate racemase [Cellvibrio zantedeschiae]GGY69990.1 glutamate racemase [Cellvibrio zantedeschiae]